MAEEYNRQHAATIEYVNEAVAYAYDRLMTWATSNIDNFDYVKRIFLKLKEAYRGGNFTSAMAYADAINAAVNDIATAIRSGGGVIGDATLAEFPTIIRQITATGFEVCILGKSGTHYDVNEYNDYVAQHGTQPENGDLTVAVITPYEAFIIDPPTEQGGTVYKTAQWGNTTDNVQGLIAQQTGSFVNVLTNSLNFNAIENTKRMLLWYNPEILPHIDFDPNDNTINYGNYNCIRFTTYAEMSSSGQMLDMTQQVYIVTNDENDGGAQNNCYYWNGTAYTKRFSVPRVVNNITGSPAAEFAWQRKSWDGDTRQHGIGNTNINLMMCVYYTEINALLSTMGRGTLPSGGVWCPEQFNAINAYNVSFPSGAVSTYNYKNDPYAVVSVAALS